MALNRRGFLTGLVAAIAAPAIIRPGLLMPIKPGLVPARVVDIYQAVHGGFAVMQVQEDVYLSHALAGTTHLLWATISPQGLGGMIHRVGVGSDA